ncbi:MAG TPA: metallophosphoesterase [Nocardioidaceae bacterium]|nr:metallophosphoesterase [Nocardioidaceae bacterium]
MSSRTKAILAGVFAVVAVVAVGLLVWTPAFVSSIFDEDRPPPSAVDPDPPDTGEPSLRLAFAGDTGTGSDKQLATARRMVIEGQGGGYDALMLLGDLIYPDGEVSLVEEVVLEPFGPLLDGGAELVPVLGNHDYKSGEQDEIMRALGREDPWYEDQIGPVRIIALDSNQVDDEEQTEWLEQTLAQPQPPDVWTVAIMHHPPYSAGKHGSDMKVREAWVPLFEEYDVPLVLAGHDHDYQRSEPQNGVTYVVSGAGAKSTPTGDEEFTAVSEEILHYSELLVYEDRLVGRAIDQDGGVLDRYTIKR